MASLRLPVPAEVAVTSTSYAPRLTPEPTLTVATTSCGRPRSQG